MVIVGSACAVDDVLAIIPKEAAEAIENFLIKDITIYVLIYFVFDSHLQLTLWFLLIIILNIKSKHLFRRKKMAEVMDGERRREGDHSFSLTKTFTTAAGFIVGGYIGSLIFDPLLFPVIHDITNVHAQALVAFMNDTFGWLHDIIGLKGEGGIMQLPVVHDVLQPYYDLVKPASSSEIAQAFPQGISLDDL